MVVLLSCLLIAVIPIQMTPNASGNVTLAEVIHQGIDSINWNSDTWCNRECLTHFGQIFDKLDFSAYDRDIGEQESSETWVNALQAIRLAEIDGYSSERLDNYAQRVLLNHPMTGTLPSNFDDQFLVFYRCELLGYKYAETLNFERGKWNKSEAFSDFARRFDDSPTFVWSCGLKTCTYNDRYYDAAAQDLGVFLKFYEIGVHNALGEADKVWQKINSYAFPGFYPYHLGSNTTEVECEICFSTIIGEYLDRKGSIPYYDRLLEDIDYKLLADGWNSADWSSGGYTVRHSSIAAPEERRLPNTLLALQVLHSYYPRFNSTMQNSFVQLLTGSTKAWQGLLQTELCDPSNHYRFVLDGLPQNRLWGNTGLVDTATATGDLLLFLEGIVPSTGSLAIPKLDELYEDVCSAFSARKFRFDYDMRTIRIPVNRGELKFQFGTTLVSYDFPRNATYEITFSDDWNSIVKVRELPFDGDVNQDGVTDIRDAIIASNAFGTVIANQNWNSVLDLNEDGKIDIFDFVVFAQNFMFAFR
jgi:hypothetical protein